MSWKAFQFGRNWKSFNESYLNDERVRLATDSLKSFMGIESFAGKTFADVGSGSGIYSLAAVRLQAAEVFSFDYDQDSVDCGDQLKMQEGNPAQWHITKGSVLDDAFINAQKQYDYVYSWGVLHHTGNMWKAIENTMKLVKPGGYFFLAIYNKADGLAIYPDGRFGPSSFWHFEKKIYASLPWFLQNVIDYFVMSVLFVLYLVTFHNPIRVIREHKYYFNKGMSWRINIKDWLGGYPYEYATVQEIFHFAKERGFSLENLTCNNGLLNNEFLLKKVS